MTQATKTSHYLAHFLRNEERNLKAMNVKAMVSTSLGPLFELFCKKNVPYSYGVSEE